MSLAPDVPAVTSAVAAAGVADLERRFGGLSRLYGARGYARVRAARVAVVGLGGVGSWAVEALARSGVAQLVLVDLDHVSESNVNGQIQALGSTLGMAKAEALARRIADIHPGCVVHCIEEFVDADNCHGSASDSLVSGGCIVSGATVTRSVLFSRVHARSGAKVDQAVVLPDVDIGKGARLSRVVIDRRCVIPPGMVIGDDPALDARRFHRTEHGVVLVTRDMLAAL